MIDQHDQQYPFLKIGAIVQQYMDTPSIKLGEVTGIKTGLKTLDDFTGGFHPGELVIVSGFPHMGQDDFLECLAWDVASKQKVPVAYFSLGRKRWKLAERLLAKIAQVDRSRLATGHLRKEDEEKVQAVQKNFQEIPLYINDSNGLTAHDIRRHLDECLVGEYGVLPGLVIVDYLQLIQGWGGAATRKDEIDAILSELADIARSGNVPLILNSLLYPECRGGQTHYTGQMPILADLMSVPETSSIDKYADTVMFFHRNVMPERSGGPSPDNCILSVIIEKSRKNCAGCVHLASTLINGWLFC